MEDQAEKPHGLPLHACPAKKMCLPLNSVLCQAESFDS